jgi:hypothetical protein
MNKLIFTLLILFLSKSAFSQNDSLLGLQSEVLIHPCNSNTAYTLKKNEIIVNWTPQFLPIPTWINYGLSDKITLTIDNNIIAGLLVDPHLPVLSINSRFKLKEQKRLFPSLAYETMVQYLYVEYDQATNPYFATWRKGLNWYNHLNMSWRINKKLYVHASVGFSFSHYLRLVNKDSLNFQSKEFSNKLAPDYMLGVDYRLRRISFHLNYSYGSTFNYIDNVARKTELVYGIRMAPFYKSKIGFFRTLHFEWIGFYNKFNDINADAYVPIFLPYVYWQWKIK